ncbi:hypothetical protein [Rhodoferax sp.]|uniref:hypothetical protein n=1 Tax=Rhodoferax sp. TaxID=50421 RepID=UPI00262A91C3|nr:hypothetical protein [Rhodoferax sp.]MDD2809249.1 hypothetical protein [Rhodoferax sp.]
MFYTNLCCGIFLITSSFFTMAADLDAYEKCASIKASSERVNCYDSLAKGSAKKQNPSASSITKKDARAKLIEELNSDADFRDNPAKKEVSLCMIDVHLDAAFSEATVLDSATFERRMSASMDRMKTAMKSEDPDVTLKILKCVINSDALAQAMKEKGKLDRSVPLIDMDDLRTDIASLNGRKVRVQGVGHYMMNMFMLKKNSSDMSPMIVDITKLQRDQYRKILQQCADIMAGCRVTVYGTVGKVSYQNGIFAETIEW